MGLSWATGRRDRPKFPTLLRLALAIGGQFLLGSCVGPSFEYRYRMTIEVQTPEGIQSSSSVFEVLGRKGSGIPDDSVTSRIKGEAVAIDLPNGTIYGLMRWNNFLSGYVNSVIGAHIYSATADDRVRRFDAYEMGRYIESTRPSFELSPDEYPLFAYFSDPKDRTSIVQLDPQDLGPVAPGSRVSKITVSVTDDRVTTEILDRLPWLSDHSASLQPPPRGISEADSPFASRILGMDFIMGKH